MYQRVDVINRLHLLAFICYSYKTNDNWKENWNYKSEAKQEAILHHVASLHTCDRKTAHF